MELKIVDIEEAIQLKEIGFMIFNEYWYKQGKSELQYIGDESLSDYDASLSDYMELILDKEGNIIDYEDGYYFAPTQSLVIKWFEQFNIFIQPFISFEGKNSWQVHIDWCIIHFNGYKEWYNNSDDTQYYETRDIAEKHGIIKAIKILKDIKK